MTRTLLIGLAALCLLPSLTGCASKPAVRTETVEVKVPVTVSVPDELVEQEAEPRLAPDPVLGEDLADFVERLKAWGRQGWCRVERIGNLGPREDATAACEKLQD